MLKERSSKVNRAQMSFVCMSCLIDRREYIKSVRRADEVSTITRMALDRVE